MKTAAETWEDIVIFDGLKVAKTLVDTRTDLEYVLQCTRAYY